MTLTRSATVERVCARCELKDRAAVREMLEVTIEEMKRAIARGERMIVTNFGVFKLIGFGARSGRNLWTGERIPIKARRAVRFKPCQELKRAVNRGGGETS